MNEDTLRVYLGFTCVNGITLEDGKLKLCEGVKVTNPKRQEAKGKGYLFPGFCQGFDLADGQAQNLPAVVAVQLIPHNTLAQVYPVNDSFAHFLSHPFSFDLGCFFNLCPYCNAG